MQNTSKLKVHDGDGELLDEMAKFPEIEELEELFAALPAPTLRELSLELVKGSIDYLRDHIDRLEYAGLINSWLVTAEETVAAGKVAGRIAARRKDSRQKAD